MNTANSKPKSISAIRSLILAAYMTRENYHNHFSYISDIQRGVYENNPHLSKGNQERETYLIHRR